MKDKIYSLEEVSKILEKEKSNGKRIIHCHGVFDLLHPGHIYHLKKAKEKGDLLIVTVTANSFVNKGPDRPFFSEKHRMQSLAALQDVDYVALSPYKDGKTCIEKIKPNQYVKGEEYKKGDLSGKIQEEREIIEKYNGKLSYTCGFVSSSSTLLNRFFDSTRVDIDLFLKEIHKKYSVDKILEMVEDLSSLKVLVIGDAILDQYQYISPLGQSSKGSNIVVNCLEKELFLGGALIVAEHIAQFSSNVTLVTPIGYKCSHRKFIEKSLNPKIKKEFFSSRMRKTLIKKRYIHKQKNGLNKLFETYSHNEELLSVQKSKKICEYIKTNAKNYDLVVVPDFGNGFIDKRIRDTLCKIDTFLAVSTQVNSGNKGFHTITQYALADFISINENELRHATLDASSSIIKLMKNLANKMKSKAIMITKGENGAISYCKKNGVFEVPAFSKESLDSLGAGDSFFALASLCIAKGYSSRFAAFIASVAAALDIKILGNKNPVDKLALCKFLVRLFK